jgi:hypothetical protein
MTSLRRLPTRKRLAQKQAKFFDSKVFLANVAAARDGGFFGRGMHRLGSTLPAGNRRCDHGVLDF